MLGLSPQVGASLDGRLLRFLLQSLRDPPLWVTLWTGETILPASGDPVAHVWIANRASLLKLIADPEFQFGECYCDGSVEVEGDPVSLLETLIRAPSETASISNRSLGLVLCASGALLGATMATAADRGGLSNAQAVYKRDRAASNARRHQPRPRHLPAGSRRGAPGSQARPSR